MIQKFTKKPVTVEAIKLETHTIKACYDFIHGCSPSMKMIGDYEMWSDYCANVISNGMDIPTLEDGKDKRAAHVASIGDYIIKGIKGEFYPCKPDIFEQTYDLLTTNQ